MEAYEKYLNDEEELAKPKFTNTQLLISGLVIIILILGVYVYTEIPTQDIEVVRNESLILGFNAGVEQWNTQVISKVNNDAVIPYYYNQTYYELNIAQLCSGDQDA